MAENEVAPQVKSVGKDNVGLADPNVKIDTFERYKGRKDQTDRVAIISQTLKRSLCYWYETPTGKGYVKAPENDALREQMTGLLGAPAQRFGMVLFKYLTDDKGALIDESKLRGVVCIWVVSETRYAELSGVHREWPLMDAGFQEIQHDLQIACTEEKFQRMTFTSCAKAVWKSSEAWYKALTEKEAKARGKMELGLGQDLGDDEIKALLGLSSAPTQATRDAGSEIDITDIVGE